MGDFRSHKRRGEILISFLEGTVSQMENYHHRLEEQLITQVRRIEKAPLDEDTIYTLVKEYGYVLNDLKGKTYYCYKGHRLIEETMPTYNKGSMTISFKLSPSKKKKK